MLYGVFSQVCPLVTPGLLPTAATLRPTNRLIMVDLPQLGTPAKAILITGLEAPFDSSLATFELAAFLIIRIKTCILVLCNESRAITTLPLPLSFFCHILVITGSAKSALFKIIKCDLSPTSSLIIGFRDDSGMRASKTSTKTSINPILSSSWLRALFM